MAGLLICTLTANAVLFVYAGEKEPEFSTESAAVGEELPGEALPEESVQVPEESSEEDSVQTPAEGFVQSPEEVIQAPAESLPEEITETQEEVIPVPEESLPGVITQTSGERQAEEFTQAPAESSPVEAIQLPGEGISEEGTSEKGVVSLSAVSALGENRLRIPEGQEAFAKALFSEEEIREGGQSAVTLYADSAEVFLRAEEGKEETGRITEEERNAIKEEQAILGKWAEDNGFSQLQYFVLCLEKTREGQNAVRIRESRESLRMILELSDQLWSEAEAPVLVCVQNGQTVVCDDLDEAGETITFDSRIFGTYALACRSAAQEEEPAMTEGKEPGTDAGTAGETEWTAASSNETADIVIETSEGDIFYRQGSIGCWNPRTHSYENAAAGDWVYENGGNVITLRNKGTQDQSLILLYCPVEKHSEITGTFTDAQGVEVRKVRVPAGGSATVYLQLAGVPEHGMNRETIGNVTYRLAGEE